MSKSLPSFASNKSDENSVSKLLNAAVLRTSEWLWKDTSRLGIHGISYDVSEGDTSHSTPSHTCTLFLLLFAGVLNLFRVPDARGALKDFDLKKYAGSHNKMRSSLSTASTSRPRVRHYDFLGAPSWATEVKLATNDHWTVSCPHTPSQLGGRLDVTPIPHFVLSCTTSPTFWPS